MKTNINGRTPEEIKGLLANRRSFIINTEGIFDDALTLINQLQEDKKQLERERDAAVEQLKQADAESFPGCDHRKHNIQCQDNVTPCNICSKDGCPCASCIDMCNWQWRGVQEVEN